MLLKSILCAKKKSYKTDKNASQILRHAETGRKRVYPSNYVYLVGRRIEMIFLVYMNFRGALVW
jgi:hypothetical protein